MNNQTHTAAIKSLAEEIGFDAVGIARAENLTTAFDRFKVWIENGFHGTMDYMSRAPERRQSLTHILPNARSIIVVAKNYYTPHLHPANTVGKISRYAWGDDYHEVIPPMLDRLCMEIKRLDEHAETRRYTDTGAVMEKEWAVRAGVGWQGKHSNVLRRDIGSWFFLGVVVTTLDLQPDQPIMDHCGTCTACIDACPTQAIVEPYQVDATKCISYWTIETKPDVQFSLELKQNLDGWIFGCDVCQDVCPWNRFQKPTSEEKFQPRNNVTHLPPEQVVNLQQESFSTLFRKSPLKRAKLKGLQRNAEALLNNNHKT